MKKIYLCLSFVFVLALCQVGFANQNVSLPVHSLRDQGNTSHCWAYAMSNLLESRALLRQSADFTVNIELDSNYWINFERMLYIYHSKGDFYLSPADNAWQIEYWETLLKHGKNILQSHLDQPSVWYAFPDLFSKHLPLMPGNGPIRTPSYAEFDQIKKQLRTEIKTEPEAIALIYKFLNSWYPPPAQTTNWFGRTITMDQVPQAILGGDFARNNTVGSLVLIKPVTDGHFGWVRYINDRYPGFRYDQSKILDVIRLSLDHQWPVTFDNVGHAMTIVGYERQPGGDYFAVADSVPGKISWYTSASLIRNLNLVSVILSAIPGVLPPPIEMYTRHDQALINYDVLDHVTIPPR